MRNKLPLLAVVAASVLVLGSCSLSPEGSSSSSSSDSSSSSVEPSISITQGAAATVELEGTLTLDAVVEGVDGTPVWTVAVPSVLTLDTTTGNQVVATGIAEGVTNVTATVGELTATIVITVTKTGWSASEKEEIASVLGDHEIPYWADGLDYEIFAAVSEGILQISVPEVDASELSDLVLTPHQADGWADDGTSTASYLSLVKVYDDYSDVTMISAVCDDEGYVLDEGVGTLLVQYSPGVETYAAWEEAGVEDYVAYYLAEGVAIPAPSTPATIGYQVVAGFDWSSFSYTVQVLMIGCDPEAYESDLAAANWTLIEGLYSLTSTGESLPYYYDPTTAVGAVLIPQTIDEGVEGLLVQFEVNSYLATFPAEEISDFFEELTGTDVTIPAPDVSSVDIIQFLANSSYGEYTLYCYGPDISDAYIAVLTAANWTIVFEDPSNGYVTLTDPDEVLYVEIGYDSSYEDTDIIFTLNTGVYFTSWPTTAVNDAVKGIDPETTTTIPAATAAIDYGAISVGSSSVEVTLVKKGDTGLVDLTDSYAADLVAAGWTLDPTGTGLYIAPAKDFAIVIEHDDASGTLITITPYEEPSYVWPAADISTALSAIGLTVEIPAYTFAGTCGFYVDSGSSYVQVTINGSTEAELEDYEDVLILEGWTLGTSAYLGVSVFVSEDGSAVIQTIWDEDTSTATISIMTATSVSAATAYAAFSENVMFWYGQIMPELTMPAGSIGISGSLTHAEFDNQYVFGALCLSTESINSLVAEFETGILAAGWVEKDTPTVGSTSTFSITADDGYGYTYYMECDIVVESGALSILLGGYAIS